MRQFLFKLDSIIATGGLAFTMPGLAVMNKKLEVYARFPATIVQERLTTSDYHLAKFIDRHIPLKDYVTVAVTHHTPEELAFTYCLNGELFKIEGRGPNKQHYLLSADRSVKTPCAMDDLPESIPWLHMNLRKIIDKAQKEVLSELIA